MRALVVLAVSFVATVVAAPAWAGGGHDDRARHSQRAPVTGESMSAAATSSRCDGGGGAGLRGG